MTGGYEEIDLDSLTSLGFAYIMLAQPVYHVVAQLLVVQRAVLSDQEGTLRYEVPREEVTHAAAEVLESCGVYDLSIDEMDIGTIIERIFKGRGEVEA